jgi:hypothetical protein
MTDDNANATSINDLKIVNSEDKVAGIMRLLMAFKPIDINKAQKLVTESGELSREEFWVAYPGLTASPLADQLGLALLAPSSIGEFILNAIVAIGSLAEAVAAFSEFTNQKQLQALVQAWEDYSTALDGSVAEVNARKNFESLLEDINETVLRMNPKLYAAFEDPECGFVAAASATLNGDMDEDDEDEDDEEDETGFPALEADDYGDVDVSANRKKGLN